MTLPFFPNESMDIYSVHNDEYDEFGRKNEYVYKETVAIDMQPYSPESSMQRFGKILQDTYTVIFVRLQIQIKYLLIIFIMKLLVLLKTGIMYCLINKC